MVWEGRVFLSAAVAGEAIPGHAPPAHTRGGEPYLHPGSRDGELSHTLLALAYDARTGAEVWRRVAYEGPVYDNRHRGNTYASPTPLTDGEQVYFFFGSEGLFAFTLDGEPVWTRDLGDFGVWGLGHGISPVLHGELLILVCDDDGGEKSKIIAVDRRSGEVVWTTPRRVRKSWATPALLPVGGRTQMLVASYDRIAGYDPATGAEIWWTEGFDSNVIHTPVHAPVRRRAAGVRVHRVSEEGNARPAADRRRAAGDPLELRARHRLPALGAPLSGGPLLPVRRRRGHRARPRERRRPFPGPSVTTRPLTTPLPSATKETS